MPLNFWTITGHVAGSCSGGSTVHITSLMLRGDEKRAKIKSSRVKNCQFRKV